MTNKPKYVLSGFGIRILLLFFLVSFFLLMKSINDFQNQIYSLLTIIFALIGLFLFGLVGIVMIKLDKISNIVIFVALIIYVLILYRGYSYFTIKIIGLLTLIGFLGICIYKNKGIISEKEQEFKQSLPHSNWLFRLSGLREIK